MWSYTGSAGCGGWHGCAGYGGSMPMYYWPQCPPYYSPWWGGGWGQHVHRHEHEHEHHKDVPEEISADKATPSGTALVGGAEEVHFSLEYAPDAAAVSPFVKVTITDAGGNSEWNLTAIPAGYHVKRRFASAAPGATVKLEVGETTAHLRWFELVS